MLRSRVNKKGIGHIPQKCCGGSSIIDRMNKIENSNNIIQISSNLNKLILPEKIKDKVVENQEVLSVPPVPSVPMVVPQIKFEEISNIYLDNPEFVYCITGDNYDWKNYILIQFNGSLNKISEHTKETAMYLLEMSEDGSQIVSSSLLYMYDGVRADCQYAQIKFLNNSDLIILGSYTGTLTFNKNEKKKTQINELTDGGYFLAKFTGIGSDLVKAEWVLPIIALGTQNVEMSLDISDNIYLAGTYQNLCRIGPLGAPNLTSSLINDMFLAKIKPTGSLEWLRTSDKSSLPNSSLGSIRAEGIVLNLSGGEERLTVIGTYTNTFVYSNKDGTFLSVTNERPDLISNNMWVSQFNMNGDILWMNTPAPVGPTEQPGPLGYVTGYQIVYDFANDLYITGTLLGGFIFNPEMGIVGGEEDLIFVAKISVDGKWINYNYLRVKLNKNELDWYPHLMYNDRLYLSVYGIGDIYYNSEYMIVKKGTGNLTLWINTLIDNSWNEFPIGYQANVPNSSLNILPFKNDLIVLGSYIITPNNTNGFIKRLRVLV